MAGLVHGPIDTTAMIAAAARADCGALAVFLGTTRDHHDGRGVLRLEYEAYEPLALTTLERLEHETCSRFAVASCTITHRLGEVPLAEASVAVIVAAGHRAAAFDACRWAMDELKRTVPIWKKEFYAEGDSAWVKGTPLSPAAGEEPR
jgi:molybdopterin synthase catalytic subunit